MTFIRVFFGLAKSAKVRELAKSDENNIGNGESKNFYEDCSPILAINYLEFEWDVPEAGLQSERVSVR